MSDAKPIRDGLSFGFVSGPEYGPASDLKSQHLANVAFLKSLRAMDPEDCYQRFPDRWMRWLHCNFTDARKVARAFSVSERAAQKWWDGIGGVNGGKVAYAVRTWPGAAEFLFAAE